MSDKDFFLYIDGKSVKVSKEVYQEFYRSKRKEQYFMKDLKKENTIIDQETQRIKFLPSREVSFEQLLEFDVSFADPKEHLEDVVIRSILLEQAIAILSPEEQKIIQELYYLGKSEREVSTALHMARTTLQHRRDKALEKLREYLEENFGKFSKKVGQTPLPNG